MKIILDVFGCDEKPEEILKGVLLAMQEDADLQPVLAGDADVMLPILKEYKADMSKIEILDAKEVITNEDSPTGALKTKKDSSMVVGIDALKTRGDIYGMVSAGSTGALLAAATLKLGRIRGVLRPALSPLLPTVDDKEVCLIDCGANVDCKPEYLLQFAIMGASYMRVMRGIENPRIALVSVGVEDKKGNELTKAAFALLKESGLNFVGNMEARDALSGRFDVLVCDGFVGNVLLKGVEGTAKTVMKKLKNAIMSSGSAKFGALFMKKAFNRLKNDMDYNQKGGSPLLGVEKVVVKCHGSSGRISIKAGLLQTLKMARDGLVDNIKAQIGGIDSDFKQN